MPRGGGLADRRELFGHQRRSAHQDAVDVGHGEERGGDAGLDAAAVEDARFHPCIAAATGNPYWVRFVEMFSQPIRSAVKVTRANEARREDFARQVREEHEKIVAAIAAGNADQARAAAAEHMEHAAERVRLADREFWRSEGGELARRLSNSESRGGG